MNFWTIINRIYLFLVAMLLYGSIMAQSRVISGTVLDSLSRAPVQNASVKILNVPKGVITDAEGRFSILVDSSVQQLVFSATGYHPYLLSITDTTVQIFTVTLSKSFTMLAQVVVKAKKTRYRNKGNPAVELIRKVIENKSQNGPKAADYASYRQYEKVRMLMDRPAKLIMNNFVMKKFRFMFDNVDTSVMPGKKLFPIYLEEVISENYFGKQPERKKKLVIARKYTNLGEYLDMKAISQVANRLYEDINIYDNTITAFTMQFVSPVAELAPAFYMYFIEDTVEQNGEKLVQLYFSPRNTEDLLFSGRLYITLDGHYAVRKALLEVNRHINLNYIRNFHVNQVFEKKKSGHYYLSHSDMVAFFSPFPKSAGLFGERVIDITKMNDSVIDNQVFSGKQTDTLRQASVQPESLWESGRSAPLSAAESKAYSNTDSLVKMKSYNRLVDMITLLTAGYKSLGKFEIGPVGNFYSFNPVEGSRLQFGIRSKPKLSTRFFIDTYAAYGLGDQRWKYSVTGTYSINNKSIYAFPFHYLQVNYMYDTKVIGQENIFSTGNSFLQSFSRGLNNEWLYNRIFRLSYVHELENHFSFTLGMKYWQQQPAGSLDYIYAHQANEPDTVKGLTTSEISATVRWAPHEQFYQGKATRLDIVNKYPILSLAYSRGIQGMLGSQFNYNALQFNLYKRFYLAPFGFTDMFVNAGYLTGSLPYPLLFIAAGNQTYFYSDNAYNLMNNGEFLTDHFAGMNIDHYFGGFFFNKIPLLKKLRLREVVEGKILFGGLRSENNPTANPAQMLFPTLNGVTSAYVLNGQPYFEAGIGIYNIFSIARIDLIKRFTYLNHPNISTIGLRFSTNFNF